jgi:hypothetical protein
MAFCAGGAVAAERISALRIVAVFGAVRDHGEGCLSAMWSRRAHEALTKGD